MTMVDTAYLSVRVAKQKQATIKAIAQRKGMSVQQLMNTLVDGFIAAESEPSLSLAKILATLRTRQDELRHKGIRQLYVFGSVVRGDTTRGSDIDLLADFEPSAQISIVTLGSLTAYLEDLLEHKVDFGDRASFRPEILETIEHEAVEVFR